MRQANIEAPCEGIEEGEDMVVGGEDEVEGTEDDKDEDDEDDGKTWRKSLVFQTVRRPIRSPVTRSL